jgi:hypothetical protein
MVEAAEVSRRAGQLARSRVQFASAATVATAEGDGLALVLAALGIGGIWVYEQRDFLERAALDELWRRARSEVMPGSLMAARLDVRVAAEAVYEGGPVTGVQGAADAVLAFQDDAASAEALTLLHHVQLGASLDEARLNLAEEIVRLAARAGDRLLGLMGLCWRTVDLFLLGDRRADQSLQELHERAQTAGCEALAFIADVMTAMRLARGGRLADAEEAARAAFERGVAAGDPDAPAYFGAMLAAMRWWQGRGAEVIDQVRSVTASPRLGPNDHVYVAADAILSATLGDVEAAEEALARLTSIGLRALPTESSSWLATQFLVVEAAFQLGNADVAGEVRSLIEPFADLPVLPSLAVVCLGSARRTVGLAWATVGDLDAAVEHLEGAIQADRRLGNRPMAVLTEHALSAVCRARGRPGDHSRAHSLAVRAAESAARMGMALPLPPPWLAGSRPHHSAAVEPVPGGWCVEVDGSRTVIADMIGLAYLAMLVSSPGEDHDVLKLITLTPSGGHPAPDRVLDHQALADYRGRARELSRLMAASDLDPATARRLRWEFVTLTAALHSATDRHGHVRDFPTDHERARTAVRKALVRAVGAIAAADPGLGEHFRASLTTGGTCRYEPAAGWEVRART